MFLGEHSGNLLGHLFVEEVASAIQETATMFFCELNDNLGIAA